MSNDTIPDLDEALDMELGAEDDQDISKVPDRIRIVLVFLGEALILIGAFLIVIGMTEEVLEAVLIGIGLVIVAVIACVMPIVALEVKKYQYAADLSAADSQTQMQDYDWWEQIDIEDKELVMIPAYTLDGEEISWDEVLLERTIGTLKQAVQRVGGRSQLNPTILDQIVDARIEEIVAERQEMNFVQRFLMWALRIKPTIISKDFKKLAEDWIVFSMDSHEIKVQNRIGLFHMHYDEYIDIDGEIAIAPTERFSTKTFDPEAYSQAFGRDEEEDIGILEEETCEIKAWEVREIREFERTQREQKRRSWFRRSNDITNGNGNGADD